MNLLRQLYALAIVAGSLLLFSSCFDDLNTVPLDEDVITADIVYDDPNSYKQVLAKLYAGLAVSGQQGPAGIPDIAGIDEGFSTYIRQYWKAQELPTDEAIIAWNDGNLRDYHDQDWDANNEFVTAMYNRIYYQISLTNEFLRETTDAKLSDRGVSQDIQDQVAVFRAEARFLRALSYYHALDFFRNVPFVTEEDAVGAFFPEQIQATELFEFIESELLDIESALVEARQNEYGRADKAAAWTLLTKLYLNAEVYIGRDRYTEAVTYSKQVIDAGYQLTPDYAHLYVADNHLSPEIIFPVIFDGQNIRTWGGMTFVVHAAVGGSMNAAAFGLDGGWAGTRVTSALVDKFPSVTGGGSVLVAPAAADREGFTLLNVPGGYQEWNPENDETALAVRGDNDKQFEGYVYFAEAGEFKFAVGGWDENYGDTGGDGTLEAGGDNLSVAEPGYYRITADLENLTYSVEKVEFGLIGDATAGGWDADQDMSYNPETGAWEIEAELTAGEIKFRANDGWDLNYGDSGNDGLLEAGGDNIAIAQNGKYRIALYLNQPNYTYGIATSSSDGRAMFYTDGQTLEIDDITQFTQGYAVTKFTNVTRDGVVGSDLTFPDTDFLMFRLGDVYLMYAEAVLRGGQGGSVEEAITYINELRERAYGDSSGNVQRSDVNLDFILDERARELYWEGHRRTDLVRFGQLTDGTYIWPWKGGTKNGTTVESFRDVFPIPASDLGANPNLTQNTGY